MDYIEQMVKKSTVIDTIYKKKIVRKFANRNEQNLFTIFLITSLFTFLDHIMEQVIKQNNKTEAKAAEKYRQVK